MPTITMKWHHDVGLLNQAIALEEVANITVMGASVCDGMATFYYITREVTELDPQNYSCIHAADGEV